MFSVWKDTWGDNGGTMRNIQNHEIELDGVTVCGGIL